MKKLIALFALLSAANANAALTCEERPTPGTHTCIESIKDAGQYEWWEMPDNWGELRVASNDPTIAVYECYKRDRQRERSWIPDAYDETHDEVDDILSGLFTEDVLYPTVSVGMPFVGIFPTIHSQAVECRMPSRSTIMYAENGSEESITDDAFASWAWDRELDLYANTDDQWSWWEYEVVWGCDGANGDDYTWQYEDSCW